MGGMENFHMQAFFYMRLPLQTIFLCVCLRFPANTFFLLAYYLFQYLQPLQTIYFKICHPPPRQKNNGLCLSQPNHSLLFNTMPEYDEVFLYILVANTFQPKIKKIPM